MKRSIVGILFLVVVLAVISLSGCNSARVAAHNISRAANQFEVYRRVVFYNGITDTYILSVEGYVSIGKDRDGDFYVVAKTDSGEFLKHYLGLSDNVTYFAEQIEPNKVSTKRYRVIFKPSVIIPDIEIR